jgi:hypothetical protein
MRPDYSMLQTMGMSGAGEAWVSPTRTRIVGAAPRSWNTSSSSYSAPATSGSTTGSGYATRARVQSGMQRGSLSRRGFEPV